MSLKEARLHWIRWLVACGTFSDFEPLSDDRAAELRIRILRQIKETAAARRARVARAVAGEWTDGGLRE